MHISSENIQSERDTHTHTHPGECKRRTQKDQKTLQIRWAGKRMISSTTNNSEGSEIIPQDL